MKHFILCLSLVLLFLSNGKSQNRLFELLSPNQSGVDFINHIAENEKNNVLSYEYFYNGGGIAAGDINQDGLIDLYFTGNMKPNKLYLNLGNLKFKDITKETGVAGHSGWTTGVSMADINGDGLLDIYVCYSGNSGEDNRRNQLFINQGNLQFMEEAAKYGLDEPSYSTQAIFFDFDLDGDLDCYLLNHNIKDFQEYEQAQLRDEYDLFAGDKLFRNDQGKFKDISKEAGIRANPLGFGLAVSVSDINGDGWPDIYVSNDYTEPDYLYINNQNGTFTDKLTDYLPYTSHFSMGNDIADFNNDGLPDILTLDMLPEDNKRQKLLQSSDNYEL